MVILKQPAEIDRIRDSNRIVAEVLAALQERVKAGVTTLELDRISEEMVLRKGAKPAFKGYRGYPFSLCASVNDEIIHGLPSERVLVDGDIIGLDFGACYKGYYGDAALTVPVGTISPVTRRTAWRPAPSKQPWWWRKTTGGGPPAVLRRVTSPPTLTSPPGGPTRQARLA